MHPAFLDLFTGIQTAVKDIATPDEFAKAHAEGKIDPLFSFWPAVHSTDLAPIYDKLNHAKATALNPVFPESLRAKGLEDIKACLEEVLTKPAAEEAPVEPAKEEAAEAPKE